MRKMLTRILCLAVVTQFIFACTGLQHTRPVFDQASIQSHRTASAQHALLELNEIDTLIKLDNRGLAEQIDRGLRAQAAISDSFYFRKLNVRFNKQLIALEAVLDIVDNSGNYISASAFGDVLLDFSGNHLEWFPRFNKLQISSAGFSIAKDRPDIALIEVRSAFLRDVLQASLVDLRVEASFDQAALPQLGYTALIHPFETADIACEHDNCTPAPACVVSLMQCKRHRDMRDCSTCLFRNPLNNRCVNQAVDPICEAARSRQNAKYDADRKSCVASAEAAKLECERLSAQALRSCEIESGFEQSICEVIKSGIASMHEGNPLATAEARVIFQGQLGALFSNISIDGDFTRLKMDMALKSNMIVDGKLEIRPGNILQPLASCVTAWSVPFSSRAVRSVAVNRMLTTLSEDTNDFTATWSGYEVSVETTPSPLESIFVGHSHLLANCSIGLTVSDVEQAFMGEGAKFFKGQVKLEIQPMPVIIRLSPATLEYDDRVFRGDAMISSNHVRYDVGR